MQRDGREITARLVRRGPEEEEFDREFWRSIPPSRRMELGWDMVLEARLWRGEKGDEPRLQRSVCRLERR